MADAEQKETQSEASEPRGESKNPLVTVLVLLNTLITVLIGVFFYQNHQDQSSQMGIQDIIQAEMNDSVDDGDLEAGMAREDEGILFPLEGFTTNLAQDDGPRRFVWLSAVLKFSKTSSEEEFKSRRPQIRDAIINTLNSKRPNDLLKLEGKSYLKEEIKAAVNTFLLDSKVIDVYYIGFKVN